MRLSFIEASTGEVIYHTTRRSKKKIRMQKTATYAGYESVPVAADKLLQRNGGALAYPPISRVSVPLELTGSGWSIDNVPLWEYVVFVLLIVSLLVLAFTCCGRFSCNLKERAVPQARQYSLPSWILRRQTEELDAHELPTILGAVRAVTVGRAADSEDCERTSRVKACGICSTSSVK
ncbi:serine/threonine protein phosphatase, putative [Eimeria mitis]|uniref:Serine/threonine protein phosphatase, putative n=1 Tax=Eimeria mitis TaxID=44415 RepID=U6KEN4_9EIME|nr:serine/threonine protein phosphatase, putative [Eimeria mitis]CDJ33918.1 serine/threonine protein phosphatase, putative [Eimeria mitis]